MLSTTSTSTSTPSSSSKKRSKEECLDDCKEDDLGKRKRRKGTYYTYNNCTFNF